jgi:hypothetical protein
VTLNYALCACAKSCLIIILFDLQFSELNMASKWHRGVISVVLEDVKS